MDKEKLTEEIKIEIENLERLSGEMQELIKRSGEKPDFIETRAAGSILHDFYCGVEKMFERIALQIEGELPKGEDWHTELLLRMSHPIEGRRDALIGQELLEKLKQYLRFRHLFRHIYGFELSWERFRNLALSLAPILGELTDALEKFNEKMR